MPPVTPVARPKVLCIEDEHFISELYARALSKAGYDVTLILDGEQGLAAAKTNDFDIILLDIMIPNLMGTEVLRRLRTDVPNLRAKIIITTNLEQGETDRKLIESQADGYLVKAEITPKQLVEFLHSLKLN